MTSVRRFLLVPGLALLAPALVACGGSDDTDKGDSAREPAKSSVSASESGEPDEPEVEQGVLLRVDGFSVRLPSDTTKQTERVPTAAGTLIVDLYIADDGDDGNYLVAITKAPNKASVSLDGAVAGAASNVQGTVKSKKTITYAGYDGRDSIVTVQSGGQDLTVFARFLQVDNKLFQLQYVVPEKDLDEPPAGYADVLASIAFD